MANPGYGKRSVPDQPPRRRGDFAHLPEREAYIAAYVDRLPDGAAMDAKTLAKALPRHGQQAVRSALTALSVAGHLRRVREVVGGDQTRWVYRTYFSRIACDDAWWARFLADDSPRTIPPAAFESSVVTPFVTPKPVAEAVVRGSGKTRPAVAHAPDPDPAPAHVPTPARAPAPNEKQPTQQPAATPVGDDRVPDRPRSAAYEALAELGHVDARLTLSAADCAALEELATEWLTRGTTAQQLVLALTSGLPDRVHSPGAFTRKRLVEKLPPEPARAAVPEPDPAKPVRRLMECTGCAVPGRPEALPGGLCSTCRHEQPAAPATALPVHEVRRRVQELRRSLRTRPETLLAT
ncbi:MarR family transcriptional regulator [Streptomyces sp. SID3343]|uniref:MarR family transcriptional regulator n=1 Tax=Streptomyces sp. SID3343 TaxID=2690260 RepID=UPI001F3DAD69|nr:MarR family transcriptional regulator [Streptomyces sp. SID3343]